MTAEGARACLQATGEFDGGWIATNLAAGLSKIQRETPDLVLLDKAFGVSAAMRVLDTARKLPSAPRVIIWGGAVSESEALQFLQGGARGILRRSVDADALLACVRGVAEGSRWLEDCVFRDPAAGDRGRQFELTSREQQVLQLVQSGLKNREIASSLGIRPGTVKIHLKHIFEKTGVRGRYSLALDLMRIEEGEKAGALGASAS